MDNGHKVVLFYISNALIQDIPFWPLFVLATAAQQQEEKNGTTRVILFIFFLIRFAGKAWTASRTWTHGYNERNIIFSSPCILTLLPGSLKKYLAHLWCHPHTVVCDVKACFLAFHLTTCWAKTFDACKDQDACRITKKIHLWCHFWNLSILISLCLAGLDIQ